MIVPPTGPSGPPPLRVELWSSRAQDLWLGASSSTHLPVSSALGIAPRQLQHPRRTASPRRLQCVAPFSASPSDGRLFTDAEAWATSPVLVSSSPHLLRAHDPPVAHWCRCRRPIRFGDDAPVFNGRHEAYTERRVLAGAHWMIRQGSHLPNTL